MAEAISTTWYDTVATLGLVAGVTERIRLLSNVYVLGYRHPLQTAKSFATLDRLSKGRAILGRWRRRPAGGVRGAGRRRFDCVEDLVSTRRYSTASGRPSPTKSPGSPGEYFSTAELGISLGPVPGRTSHLGRPKQPGGAAAGGRAGRRVVFRRELRRTRWRRRSPTSASIRPESAARSRSIWGSSAHRSTWGTRRGTVTTVPTVSGPRRSWPTISKSFGASG